MQNVLAFRPTSGMGDKLFDTVGFKVLCDYTDQNPQLEWCEKYEIQPWGIAQFDKRLFDFGMHLIDDIHESCQTIQSFNTCVSLSIPKVKSLLKLYHAIDVSYDDLTKAYMTTFRKHIKPSHITLRYIPEGIEKCIGIHLRKSDKIKDNPDPRHEMLQSEHDDLMQRLHIYIETVIDTMPYEVFYFFVCSEDLEHKNMMKRFIQEKCGCACKTCKFMEPNIPAFMQETYINIAAVVDMFALSQCKCILQGIKYSTFSMAASIIGNTPLHNFGEHPSTSLIHVWKPCLSFVHHISNHASRVAMERVAETFADPNYVPPMQPINIPVIEPSKLDTLISRFHPRRK